MVGIMNVRSSLRRIIVGLAACASVMLALGLTGAIMRSPTAPTYFRERPATAAFHQGLFCLAIAPDDRSFVTAGARSDLQEWDFEGRAARIISSAHADRGNCLVLEPHSNTCVH